MFSKTQFNPYCTKFLIEFRENIIFVKYNIYNINWFVHQFKIFLPMQSLKKRSFKWNSNILLALN